MGNFSYNNDKEIYYDKYFSVIRISLRLLLVLLFVYLSYLLYNYYQYLKIRVAIDSGAKEELDKADLYNEIIEKANPKKFIEPYQPQKLIVANEIYSKALNNRDSKDILEELLKRIKKEL